MSVFSSVYGIHHIAPQLRCDCGQALDAFYHRALSSSMGLERIHLIESPFESV
jgi:hypothetical protein